MPKCVKHIIVFDLDETIGHFEEFGRFIDGLAATHESKFFLHSYKRNAFERIAQRYFDELLSMYPEFFRPSIFRVFKYLKKQKRKNKCLKIAIYTNNMGPRSWTILIKNYIEKKIGGKLFDRVITGYKPHKKINCRRTHEKTYADFVRCNSLSKETKILFFDDQHHHHMHHKQVRYIRLHPYRFNIRFSDMISRFLRANARGEFGNLFKFTSKESEKEFTPIMIKILGHLGREHVTYKVTKTKVSRTDKLESKRIMHAIKRFLNKNMTRRRRINSTNKTKKKELDN